MVPGVWMTLADVYAVGASAFSAHVSLWLLMVMLLATNARYRRQASLGAAALSLGYIETYYLCSSFTFAGMARSTMAPLALLCVVGAVAASVGWAAKRERGLLGLALKALVVVATLVACVATHDGVAPLDVVCTLLIAYLLFLMRPRKVALERHRPTPEERAALSRGADGRSSREADVPSTRATPDPRPSAESGRKEPARRSAAGRRRSSGPAGQSRGEGGQRPSRRRPAGAGTTASRRTSASRSEGTRPAPKAGDGRRPATKRNQSGAVGAGRARTKDRSPRPTRRTGGAVPEANRIRSSANDRHAQGTGHQRHPGGSATRR